MLITLILYVFFNFINYSFSLSNAIVNPNNPNFQCGTVQLINSGNLGTNLQPYTILYSNTMLTSSLNNSIAILGTHFSLIDKSFGYKINIMSYDNIRMYIEAAAVSGTNPLTLLRICYMTTSYINLHVNSQTIVFNSATDGVLNDSLPNWNVCAIECRSTGKSLSYMSLGSNPKANVFISGFQIVDFAPVVGIPENVFGVGIQNINAGSTSVSFNVYAYGRALLKQIKLNYISFESSAFSIAGQKTYILDWTRVGCYYTSSGCFNTSLDINTSVQTTGTGFNVYYSNSYFFGFYSIRAQYDSTNAFNINFDILSTALNGDTYESLFEFTGSAYKRFVAKYAHLIILQLYCSSSGTDIYYVYNSNKCDSQCNGTIGQYYDANRRCQLCSSKCYKCVGSATTCTACYNTAQNRVLNGNICQCNATGYYDDGSSDICPKCHYSCGTCTGPSASQCIDCPNPYNVNFRVISINSCFCVEHYYDSGNQICSACHYSCLTCSGSQSTNCLTCNATDRRVINVATNSCNCDVGYYNNGSNSLCLVCHYSCWTCSTSNTNCANCNSSTQFRNLSSNKCPCNPGYYDAGYQICQLCYITCKTCNEGTRYDCLSCYSSLKRQIQSSQCKCMAEYYQVNVTCYACHYSCYNCTAGTKYDCINCNSNITFRLFNGTNKQCYCSPGYVDTGLEICTLCDRTCLTCQNSSSLCKTCDPLKFRYLTGTSCICNLGYIDTGLASGLCQKCDYSCFTCSGILSSQCLTCNISSRILISGSCRCLNGTYDNGINSTCMSCHLQCLTCNDQYQISCTSCQVLYLRQLLSNPGPCTCIQRYFQNSNALVCDKCHISCLMCSMTSNNCTTCDSTLNHRYLASGSKCLCQAHYYQVNAQSCWPCVAICGNCSLQPDNCTSCPTERYLFSLGSSYTCLCNIGTYQDPITSICQPCDYKCLSCTNSPTQCTSCPSLSYRSLANATCFCINGYYQNNTIVCIKCPYSCNGCTGPSPIECTSCPVSSFRTLQADKTCTCDVGYYDDGSSSVCKACKSTCSSCTSYSVCSACYAQNVQFRSLVINQCKCIAGYYEDLINPICQICHYTCATCSGGLSSNCLTCKANREFVILSSSCPCQPGFYQTQQICYPCNTNCLTCATISTNCTSCTSVSRYLLNNKCFCRDGYYLNGNTCSKCDTRCGTCVISPTNCLSCNLSHLTYLNGTQCLCSTGQYQDLTTYTCINCNKQCLTCSGPAQNNCLSCSLTLKRQLNVVNRTCDCIQTYYDNSTTGLCTLCHTSCLTCYGQTEFNCSSCYVGDMKFGSSCIKATTCSIGYYSYNKICVRACPNTTFVNAYICESCINNCKSCLSAIVCTSCIQGYFYNSASQTCTLTCIKGQYINHLTYSCAKCPVGCSICYQRQISGSLISQQQIICTQCLASNYLYNYSTCVNSTFCSAPYYVISSVYCFKCNRPCLTCTNLLYNGCVTCVDNYNLHNGQCLKMCPDGYYSFNKICYQCEARCKQCSYVKCQLCNQGYFLTPDQINPKCITNGYYFNPSNGLQQRCHLNCFSCTNSSFASCITCSKNRGDLSQMAISGYCQCWPDSIDLGNGQCSYQEYQSIEYYVKTLKSSTDSLMYLTVVTSIASMNILTVSVSLLYQQSYSMFYFINSSAVLQTDHVLKQSLNRNINFYINKEKLEQFQSGNSFNNQKDKYITKLRRFLSSIQSDQSLFTRSENNQNIYLIDWIFYTVIILLATWSLIIVNSFLLSIKCLIEKKKIKILLIAIKSLCQENLIIIIHLLTVSQVSLFASGSFKYIFTNWSNTIQDMDWFKFIISIIVMLYYFGYSLKLIKITINKNNKILKNDKEILIQYDSFRILTYYFEQNQESKHNFTSNKLQNYSLNNKNKSNKSIDKKNKKNKKKQSLNDQKQSNKNNDNNNSILQNIPLSKRLFIPLLMFQLMLKSILLMVFSFSPIFQVISNLLILIAWTVYSFSSCPYPRFCCVFIHLNQIFFIGQVSILLYSVLSQQSNRIFPAYILLILNGLQIVILAVFGVVFLLKVIMNICGDKKNYKTNKISNIYQNINLINIDKNETQINLDLKDNNQNYIENTEKIENDNIFAYQLQQTQKYKINNNESVNNILESYNQNDNNNVQNQNNYIVSKNVKYQQNSQQNNEAQQIIIKKKYRKVRKNQKIKINQNQIQQ